MESERSEQPITEQSNQLSKNIDVASPKDISSILYACDQEIFFGWKGSKGVKDTVIQDKAATVAQRISQVIENPSGCVVISGCGTSGRLAFLTAQTFNAYLKSQGKQECFKYIISGGDGALFRSLELAEDDPIIGAQTLQEATIGKTAVVYIGVTCGMSAPFVAGQLDYCLSHLDVYTPVLMGFNHTHQARNVQISKWDKTFLQVVEELQKAEKASKGFILNPIIGPETITGSSRMKSGTTTRVLLETLSIAAVHGYPSQSIAQLTSMYEAACHSVYKHTETLAQLIKLAGDSLLSNGHIYYLGCGGFGLMGIIDASECVPTYGASFHDIRGFVDGGFSQLHNNDGDISQEDFRYRISVDDFQKDVVPTVQAADVLIILGDDVLDQYKTTIASLPCHKAAVFIQINGASNPVPKTDNFDIVLNVDLDIPSVESLTPDSAKVVMSQLLREVALKWVVNNISTGAYVLKGKVYENIMVDVRASNNKLFYRATGIVQKYSGVSKEEATECLLKSIYHTDQLTNTQKSASIEEHIMAASAGEKVVPTAILLAALQCTVESAKNMIQNEPAIRKLLDSSVRK